MLLQLEQLIRGNKTVLYTHYIHTHTGQSIIHRSLAMINLIDDVLTSRDYLRRWRNNMHDSRWYRGQMWSIAQLVRSMDRRNSLPREREKTRDSRQNPMRIRQSPKSWYDDHTNPSGRRLSSTFYRNTLSNHQNRSAVAAVAAATVDGSLTHWLYCDDGAVRCMRAWTRNYIFKVREKGSGGWLRVTFWITRMGERGRWKKRVGGENVRRLSINLVSVIRNNLDSYSEKFLFFQGAQEACSCRKLCPI